VVARIGSFQHLTPTEASPVPGNTALHCAVELDEALHHLIAARDSMERLGLAEGRARCVTALCAVEDAVDELHQNDPEVDDD
jgi:hypothetical protein